MERRRKRRLQILVQQEANIVPMVKREHASVGKNVEKIEEKVPKDKQKTIHCHWKNKARQRADQGLNVVAQTPVIPDLLL
ncbi:hypothetical protein LOK49_LG04G01713 [Camellia lanceoleosa]|uniref:Uncharacterized protein n=1 Tax=Camellia lanceoleosa TaxID=1840588 RepID=A0ACC0I3Q5_9ERIC|nr:hypothetical protein LOK49_LG04G01713 [Camellia lanceoleosa]